MTQTILILGANSDIARALSRHYAADGYHLILAARQAERLHADQADLTLRGAASVKIIEWDALTVAPVALAEALGVLPDVVVCAVGVLGNQKQAEKDGALAAAVMIANYTAPALILGEFAKRMEEAGHGMIIGISSVAGERGRGSNYIYGSAKAGFTAFLSGLRNRLADSGVHVMTVKPGFVNTQMTAGMKLPAFLTAEPETVAQAIIKGAAKKSDVIYSYGLWRWIMLIIAHIPERIFKKLKL